MIALDINWRDMTVTRGRNSLALSRIPLLLIEKLATSGSDIVPIRDIESYIFSGARCDNALKVHIYRLRSIIGNLGIQIENKRDVGYRLVEEKA